MTGRLHFPASSRNGWWHESV